MTSNDRPSRNPLRQDSDTGVREEPLQRGSRKLFFRQLLLLRGYLNKE